MAQVILGAAGQAIGGEVGRAVGAALGAAADRALVAGLQAPRQRGPRLEGLRLQSSAEGAPMAWVAGRARVTGQVIWAARFREAGRTERPGKGGPGVRSYSYSLSFAVALCEGPIDGVGRVWADGRPLDLTGVTMRVHRGTEDQTPDPLIEAVEGFPSTPSGSPSPGGGGYAPAYRGTAYVVFEDLPLAPFGNRPPQLSFEVFRRPLGGEPRLEDRLEGVCLIPGAGEFVLATEVVRRREGLTRTRAENLHTAEGRADVLVSLDQLQAQAPNLKRVSLVIGWFGTDVRAGHVQLLPGVERRDKPTEPLVWSVAGLERASAHLISQNNGAPAYGGTPSDETVRQAVAELKRRGLEVTLYPFVFMDCAGYPWRGRVAGRNGAEASGDVAAAFGAADGWGLRRMARHYAALAAETGADGLLIGSEMRGLTLTRDAAGGFPAVAELRALAAECRAIVGPDVHLSYAADWSEYAGLRDGPEAVFHLDPLWADPNIDHVAIDWYPPLGDWRDGDGGVDAAAFAGPDDPAYLRAQVAGGEGFDWFYASGPDRAAQTRTPIQDGAHGEHWVYRVKDLKGWWSNLHHDRPGGVRAAEATTWRPGMKPIRLTEFGCAAVDRGANAPNLFQDPKSTENALPPFSTGAGDDRMQRRALEAVLSWFAEDANNPVSAAYGGRMLKAADAWCWDARPYPAFPARADVWADAGAWTAGHWLNGRLTGETADILRELLARAGVEDAVIDAPAGEITGYVVDRPMRIRDALEPLLQALQLTPCEQDGRVTLVGDRAAVRTLREDELALPQEGVSMRAERSLVERPGLARVRFIDEAAEYQTGAVTLSGEGMGGAADLDLPAVCGPGLARAAAERLLAGADEERLVVSLGPLDLLRIEAGDVVAVEGRSGLWRAARLSLDEQPSATLEPLRRVAVGAAPLDWRGGEPAEPAGTPFFRLLELPPLPGHSGDARAVAVVAADPWRSMEVFGGPTAEALTSRGAVGQSATVGRLVEPLAPGVIGRWDEANVVLVRLEGRAPESASDAAVFAGANLLAVETAAGWEMLQFQRAELVAGGTWRLSGLLRAQGGTEAEMRAGAAAGALVVVIDERLAAMESPAAERGLPLIWRAGPEGAPAGGATTAELTATLTGLHARPWSPAHLRVNETAEGLLLTWLPRVTQGGDVWDVEPTAGSGRFRVRVIGDDAELRRWEVEALQHLYPAVDLAADRAAAAVLTARVSAWAEGYGWGSEASVEL